MRRLALFVVLFAFSLGARAQDVLSLGTGTTQVPVTLTKNTANAVNGVSFKVLFDGDSIASMSFARGGGLAAVTPLYERAQQGSGWFSYIVLFSSATNVSGTIGTLTVTLQPQAVPGTTVALRFDPPSVLLSNQSASVVESVANGSLSLVNGSITVGGAIAAPSGLVATASGTSLVNVTWNPVVGAAYYQIWRSVDGSAYAPLVSPDGPPYADSEVVAGKAYLYRVRAISGAGAESALSNPDLATTIVFTDDPLTAGTTIKLAHITQLRTAVNAVRASASLPPLAADPTIATGAVVRASHITALRTGLNEARDAVGVAAIAFDATLTIIRASHVTELRNGVK